MHPSKDQTTGVAERVLYGVILGFMMSLVRKGYIEADMAPYIATGVVGLVGGAWAWWINRPKAIAQSAAAIPGTTVVTTPELAMNTPESNIVSNLSKPSDVSAAIKKNT